MIKISECPIDIEGSFVEHLQKLNAVLELKIEKRFSRFVEEDKSLKQAAKIQMKIEIEKFFLEIHIAIFKL